MQTSYGCIFLKKTSVATINITLGVPGCRADKPKQNSDQQGGSDPNKTIID